jgi:hypothetical protein
VLHQIYPKYEDENTNDSKSNPMIKKKIPTKIAILVFLMKVVRKKANITIASPKIKKLNR